jgi:hypothetical protein
MPLPCELNTPTAFQTDECQGERVKAQCVVDSGIYSELQLSANATQQQINQALYLAFLNLKSQLDAL